MSSDLIRSTGPDDFEAVYLLLKQLWPDGKLTKEKLCQVYRESIGCNEEQSICYIRDGNIIGYAEGNIRNSLFHGGRLLYIGALIVDSGKRGQGIGAELLNHMKKIAVDSGCKAVELDSGFQREMAHEFYIRNGFQKIAYNFSFDL